MKRLGVIGVSWRDGDAAERLPHYAIPESERAERLPRLAATLGVRELLYLSTCNRVEVMLVGDETTPIAAYRHRVFRELRGREPRPGEAWSELRAWGGEGAAEHVLRLAAGLESAMLGEREIVAQMREALDEARDLGTGGPILEWLFEEAWKVGRRVHAATGVGEGKVSLGTIALERACERLAESPGTVVLVGVSPMTRYCARGLAEQGLPFRVCNRTRVRAEELAAESGGGAMSLDEFRSRPPSDVSAIILATGAPGSVLGRADLERLAAVSSTVLPPLIIDLATPPDVEPADARAVDLPRIGLDEVLRETEAHRRRREREGLQAAEIVEEALDGLEDKLVAGVLSPLLAALQRRYRATAHEGLERLLASEVPVLAEAERERLERWADVLARRFAHLPATGLKALAKSHGLEAVQSFLEQGDVELREELERIRKDRDRLLPGGVEQQLRALRSVGR